MRISDWSSDVCSSDLGARDRAAAIDREMPLADDRIARQALEIVAQIEAARDAAGQGFREFVDERRLIDPAPLALDRAFNREGRGRTRDRKSTRLNSSH